MYSCSSEIITYWIEKHVAELHFEGSFKHFNHLELLLLKASTSVCHGTHSQVTCYSSLAWLYQTNKSALFHQPHTCLISCHFVILHFCCSSGIVSIEVDCLTFKFYVLTILPLDPLSKLSGVLCSCSTSWSLPPFWRMLWHPTVQLSPNHDSCVHILYKSKHHIRVIFFTFFFICFPVLSFLYTYPLINGHKCINPHMVFLISWGNLARPYWFLKELDLKLMPSQNLRKVSKWFRPSRYFPHRKKKWSSGFLRKLGRNLKYLGTSNERKPAEGPLQT